MRFTKFILRRIPTRRQIKGLFIFRLFGKYVLAHDLWHLNGHSVAGGLALGLFIALTPTFPFQMILTAALALYFRVNLPVGLAACWVTNPFTMMPIYTASWKLGRSFLNWLPFVSEFFPDEVNRQVTRLVINSVYLWAGSLIIASASSLVSYFIVKALWIDIHDHKQDDDHEI